MTVTREQPRILIGASNSGGGKTTVVCALLAALTHQGYQPAAFKCGPDYIDPLFHQEVIGAKGANLDLFFTREETVCQLLGKFSHGCGVAVIEGVMGYYDGVGGTTSRASAWEVAKATQTPAVLVLDARGAALSLCAQLKGFLEFAAPSMIKGVILNRCSPMQYQLLAAMLEERCGVQVFGYLPQDPDFGLESRHLGLVTASEIEDMKDKLCRWGEKLRLTVDVPRLMKLAETASPLYYEEKTEKPLGQGFRIAVAKDKAFCFYYRENLTLLEELGAEIVPFSPLEDAALPQNIHALYLGGGYPELYAQRLSQNVAMRSAVARAVAKRMPVLAECGGFMYLQEAIADEQNTRYPMAGVFKGSCSNTGSLSRFGYITLTAQRDTFLCKAGESIAAHEFHYYDSTNNGQSFTATKPVSGRSWQCIQGSDRLFAGFPHLYFYSNKDFAKQFVLAAQAYQKEIEQ
ncbi:MAG: cobyrinate a,c-diamide synthase [Angelakisella sp.]|nr:cobyrinate a,c-diamide synthase [Angelakisella sp.]